MLVLVQARSIFEEVVALVRRAGASVEDTVALQAFTNNGASCLNVGDFPVALALAEEGAAMALRVLGEAHPMTQTATQWLSESRDKVAIVPPNSCAVATPVGLGGRPELNGETGFVVGFDNGPSPALL